jgi:TonB family protein
VLGEDRVWRKIRLRDGKEVWASRDAIRLGSGPNSADDRSDSNTLRVGSGVSAPRALYAPDPEYSEEARNAGYQGTVVLWLVVGADGLPHDIRVQRPLGKGLDEKAVEAVRKWKFEPTAWR